MLILSMHYYYVDWFESRDHGEKRDQLLQFNLPSRAKQY